MIKIYFKNRKQLETYTTTHLGADKVRVKAEKAKDTDQSRVPDFTVLAKVPVPPAYVLPMLLTK